MSEKNENFEKMKYLSNECISQEDFSSIKCSDEFWNAFGHCGSVLRAFVGKQGWQFTRRLKLKQSTLKDKTHFFGYLNIFKWTFWWE